MDFGIDFFPTDNTLQPVELGQALEERGFESVWLAEHSHIPSARTTPAGGVKGAAPLAEKYWRTHDQMIALAAMAATTTNLKLGTGITLLAQRDPVWTAKETASIDAISNGRLMFGIGYGWNIEEMASHGTAYNLRRELLREKMLMVRSLWTDEEASFQGEHLTLEPSWSWPKPTQQPHPPIILGAGAGPKTIAHLVEFCDGWIPLGRHELGPKVAQVLQAVEDAGRDPSKFELTSYMAQAKPEFVDQLMELGFTRAAFNVESLPPAQVLEKLDQLAEFVSQY